VDTKPVEFKNVFTPNGDGYNDTYSIPQKEYEFFRIEIRTLRGDMVYQSSDPSESWNGTLDNKGTACAAGEYVAYIVYKLPGSDTQRVNQPLTLIVQ
jgi:gliding motility-associated-like protein